MTLTQDALILITVDTVLLALATGAVVLRFSIRHHQGSSPQADDWTILAALVFAIAICLVGIYDSATGLIGVSLFEMSQSTYIRYRKSMFAEILIGQNVYGLVKISVILFYRRIFQSRQFKFINNIVIVFPILYMVISFFVVFFCARDVSSFWMTPVELEGSEYVLKFGTIIVSLTIADIALDLIILILPLPVIRGLQIDKKQKIHVAGIFLLGAFCLVSSGVRLFYTIPLVSKSTPVTELIGIGDDNELWSHIEACAAVFTACLPTYAPLYRGFKSAPLITKTKSLFSFHKGHSHNTSTKISVRCMETPSREDVLLKNELHHVVRPEWV